MSRYKYTIKELKEDFKNSLVGSDQPETVQHNIQVLKLDNIPFRIDNLSIKKSEKVKLKTWNTSIWEKNGNTVGEIATNNKEIESVIRSLDNLHIITNLFSLLFDSGDWHIRLIESEITTTQVFPVSKLEKIEKIFKELKEKFDGREFNVYIRAIDQFKTGIVSRSLTNKFLSFFRAIEYLSEELYLKKYKSEIKKSPSQKNNCIQDFFKELDSITEIKRQHIHECYFTCVNINIKSKIKLAFEKAFKEEWEKYFDEIFKKDGLNDIRNSIAHGEFSEYKEEHKLIIENNLDKVQSIARKFLIKTQDIE